MQSSPGGRAQVIDAHTKVNKETGHLGYNYLNGPPNQTRLLACPATAASLATTSLSTAVCLGRLFSPEEITPGLRSSLVRRGQSVPQVLCRVDAPWQRAPGLTGGGLPVTPSNISHSAPHSRRALRTSTSPADLKTLKRTAQNDAAIGRLEAHDSREGETKSNKHTTERPDAKHTKAISGSPKKKKIHRAPAHPLRLCANFAERGSSGVAPGPRSTVWNTAPPGVPDSSPILYSNDISVIRNSLPTHRYPTTTFRSRACWHWVIPTFPWCC